MRRSKAKSIKLTVVKQDNLLKDTEIATLKAQQAALLQAQLRQWAADDLHYDFLLQRLASGEAHRIELLDELRAKTDRAQADAVHLQKRSGQWSSNLRVQKQRSTLSHTSKRRRAGSTRTRCALATTRSSTARFRLIKLKGRCAMCWRWLGWTWRTCRRVPLACPFPHRRAVFNHDKALVSCGLRAVFETEARSRRPLANLVHCTRLV